MTVQPLHSVPRCLLCATTLDPGARKCVKCGAYQDGRECVSCGATMPNGAARCAACKTLQMGVPCRVCGATIEEGCRRCSHCGEWQNRRRFVPASQVTLALVLSLLSVLSATVPPVLAYFANRSQTYVRIIGEGTYAESTGDVPELTIRVLVVNNGKRPSMVKSAIISFPGLAAEDTPLAVLNAADALILPEKHAYIHLSTGSVRRKGKATKPEILDTLTTGKARIALDVEETDRNGDFYDAAPPPHHTIDASKLTEWMTAHVSSARQ
jgi:predicted nucleic acid-binding Zn ribbon protein